MVRTHTEDAGFRGKLSAGVVLTGGASAMPGTAELAIDVFGIGARVGSPSENISGLTDSVEAPRFATAVGLAHYAAGRLALGHAGAGGKRLGEPKSRGSLGVPKVDEIAQRMKVWLQDFF
jgi:cell division protein FtsA